MPVSADVNIAMLNKFTNTERGRFNFNTELTMPCSSTCIKEVSPSQKISAPPTKKLRLENKPTILNETMEMKDNIEIVTVTPQNDGDIECTIEIKAVIQGAGDYIYGAIEHTDSDIDQNLTFKKAKLSPDLDKNEVNLLRILLEDTSAADVSPNQNNCQQNYNSDDNLGRMDLLFSSNLEVGMKAVVQPFEAEELTQINSPESHEDMLEKQHDLKMEILRNEKEYRRLIFQKELEIKEIELKIKLKEFEKKIEQCG